MKRASIVSLSGLLFFVGSCGGSDVPGRECLNALECAPAGDAICNDGICRLFGEQEGFGSVTVDLSFPREILKMPTSGYIHFLFPRLADGSPISCEQVLAGGVDLANPGLNRLQSAPKYLVFNCCGTFFPNNLVQFIRPATGALAVAEGYENLDGGGRLLALGCVGGVDIEKDMVLEDLLISLQEQ